MRNHYDGHDVRTIRLLHEYGFTDSEMADHLELPPLVVRRLRASLSLPAHGFGSGLARDRRRARERLRMDPAQRVHGAHQSPRPDVHLKLSDDRFFVAT